MADNAGYAYLCRVTECIGTRNPYGGPIAQFIILDKARADEWCDGRYPNSPEWREVQAIRLAGESDV